MDFLWNVITVQVQSPPFIVIDFHHFNSVLLSYSISISWPELSASALHTWYWGKRKASPLSSLLSLFLSWEWELKCPLVPTWAVTFWGEAVLHSFGLHRRPSKNIFPPPLFLAKKQTNKIIIIIKGITSLPSHSDMLSAKIQIKSVRQSENAVKTGALF